MYNIFYDSINFFIRQVNTAGFNKPFDEALPIFTKEKDGEISEVIENLSDHFFKINCRLEKINVRLNYKKNSNIFLFF